MWWSSERCPVREDESGRSSGVVNIDSPKTGAEMKNLSPGHDE